MGAVRRGLLLAAALLGMSAGGAAAQVRDSIPGVTLGLEYVSAYSAGLAVKPFSGRFGGAGVASQVEAIIGRDLRNSDRFEVMDSLPAALLGEGIDYTLWDRLGAVWLLTGQVEGAGSGFVLVLELHDVVYGSVKEQGRFRLPDAADEDFRMAVHRASDQVVQWATGEPGMAASRIAFSLVTELGNKELFLIDSDGENLRRITNYASITLSPTWHPSGEKLAFTSYKNGEQRIYELRDCCLVHLSGGPRVDDLSPSYSPDGRRMVFQTNRFGTQVPQIMVMPGQGGEAETVSPYEYGRSGSYAAPEWSPVSDLVAFHGAIRRGTHHILVADLGGRARRLRQLTWEGNNEDPSWAPDGRHLVFIGERRWGYGLFVVDVATGKLRTLLEGRRVTVPSWSPALRPAR